MISALIRCTACLLAILLLPLAVVGQGNTGKKRALLIAVTGYNLNKSFTIPELDTAIDVDSIGKVLQSDRYKFEDVQVLKTPAQTTRAAIEQAFQSLIDRTQENDIVYFHFSGHGSNVPDPKDTITGQDQTIVPQDALPDGSRDIKDKEIKVWLARLAEKKPRSVTLVFDSCFSGSITRDPQHLVRGFERVARNKPASQASVPGQPSKTGGLISSEEAERLGYIAISACRDDETDSETFNEKEQPMGSLTYAICKALLSPERDMTYRDIFESIQSTMKSKGLSQTPVIQGRIDKKVFDSAILPPEPYILVDAVPSDGAVIPVLKAGHLMGLSPGCKINIYPAGTREFKTALPIAKATLTECEAVRSGLNVELMPGTKMESLRDARAIVTERVYPDNPLKVDLSALKDHPRLAAIKAKLQEGDYGKFIKFVSRGTPADVRILPVKDAFTGTVQMAWDRGTARIQIHPPAGANVKTIKQIVLQGADPSDNRNLVLQRITDSNEASFLVVGAGKKYVHILADGNGLPEQIADALQHESRRRLLTSIPGQKSAERLKVEVHVITVNTTKDSFGRVIYTGDEKVQPPVLGGKPRIPLGKYFRVELRNAGDNPAYVSVIGMSEDGSIYALWPNARTPVTNLLPPKKLQKIEDAEGKPALWRFSEPAGNETFFAFATEEPVDFSVIVDPARRGEGARGAGSLLGRLVTRAANRGPTEFVINVPEAWGADTFEMTLEPVGSK